MWHRFLLLVSGCVACFASLFAEQAPKEHGHSFGRVTLQGDLIVVELHEGVLGKQNLFDLTGRTLHFVPGKSGFLVQNTSLQWENDFGPELSTGNITLRQFEFPYAGKTWRDLLAGPSGSIRFGLTEEKAGPDGYGKKSGGIFFDRFDQLGKVGSSLGRDAPAVCVFFKPRLFGSRFAKELPDRVVLTWDLTEPFGGLIDFSWFKTDNRFQAVLHRDGSIDLSYKEIAAKDAIVGLYASALPKEVHFSALKPADGSFPAVFESFHYVAPPSPQDVACTVLEALGDKFDLLAYYSDFRVDSQEASSPSEGPLGNKIKGIGPTEPKDSASFCSDGRLQLTYEQPIFVGANEMQPWPPENAPKGPPQDITFYRAERLAASPGGKPRPYDYAIAHLGHEWCHRWGAYVSAKIQGEIIPLGPIHWDRGLHAPVAFPYQRPVESSILGGGVWQDNFDGTYSQLRNGYFVPAPGYSYLDLYLMGLISATEVPDFFILRNLNEVGKDRNGKTTFKASRLKVTIDDVIAAEGPRLPDFEHSQRKFNTGIVVLVEYGHGPSSALLERADGIRQQWMEYWKTTTGGRAIMTTSAH